MKIVLYLVQLVLFLVALTFLVQNHGQFVDINLFGLARYPNVDILVIILVSFTVGAVVTWIYMTFAVIHSRSDQKRLRQKNRQLMKELENLRNVSIDDIPEEGDALTALPASKTEVK